VIPNVFGPFGNPYYNSVIATFCHQLTHNEQPKIDIDGEIKLIYVSELVGEILKQITNPQSPVTSNQSPDTTVHIPHTATIKVSELLQKLEGFKSGSFDRNVFTTFLCYIDHKSFFPFHLKKNTDDRGSFVETMRLHSGGQVSFSTTVPGITRGNHFHTRKAERFAVIKGKALIELRRIGTTEVLSFELDGDEPSFVDMPVWYTHNIKNIGDEELYTVFWINEFFDADDADTFFETV
jgi:UDP-2-acetamido-2,6-beta-L-arabino-hexul-4-ose reductase